MRVIREYKRAESLEEAWQLNQKKSNRVLGGMVWLKMGKMQIGTAIDISGLGLNTIEETEEEFRIGCMVTLRDLELDPGLNTYTGGAMREAVRHIVGVQFRNLATVGGSIYGRYGFSDVLTMFLAMDSYVELYKGGIIPLREYMKMPYDRDIRVRLIVKKEKAAFDYQSVRNTQNDFPVLTCASAKTECGYRFSIGARPGKAVLFELDDADIQAADVENTEKNAVKCVKEQIETGSNTRGSAEYRKHLAEVLVKRAVCKLAGKQKRELPSAKPMRSMV